MKAVLILSIIAAFVVGSISTNTIAYAASGGQGNNLIADAINQLTSAVQQIETTVNVESIPVDVSVTPSAPKKVVDFNSQPSTDLECPDGTLITGVSSMSFLVDEFGIIPASSEIRKSGGALFTLSFYDVNIDENGFEVIGRGTIPGGAATCDLSSSTFTFSITGTCSDNTEIQFATSAGMRLSTTGSASCLLLNPDILNPDIINPDIINPPILD